MRDRLTFAARLIDGEIVCTCEGFDHNGDEMCFVVPAALFHANLQRQAHWAGRVELAAAHYRAGIEAGMTEATAWTATAPFLPDDLEMGVALRPVGQASG